MSNFTTNILVPKSIKANFKYKKAAHFGEIDTNRLVQSKNFGVIFPRRRQLFFCAVQFRLFLI